MWRTIEAKWECVCVPTFHLCMCARNKGVISMMICSTWRSSREFVNLPARLRKLPDYQWVTMWLEDRQTGRTNTGMGARRTWAREPAWLTGFLLLQDKALADPVPSWVSCVSQGEGVRLVWMHSTSAHTNRNCFNQILRGYRLRWTSANLKTQENTLIFLGQVRY